MKYKYGKGLLTYGQCEQIAKRHYPNNWEERLAVMTRHPAYDLQERICLKCSKNFEARGKFERICQRCKGSDEWIEAELSLL